jgi:predicted DNA binding CopG/RHH family protein
MTPEQIVRFLDDFRKLQPGVPPMKSRRISMKVPEPLLNTFKTKARLSGVPYQPQIKRLMSAWLEPSGRPK